MPIPAPGAHDPPRTVPAEIRTRLRMGSPLALLGWAIAGVGMVVVLAYWIFQKADTRFWAFSLALEEVPGQVIAVEETRHEEGSGRRARRPIFCVRFAYQARNGTRYEGKGYTATHADLRPGARVVVEHPARYPQHGRLKTPPADRGVAGEEAVLLLAVPLLGWVLVWVGWRQGDPPLGLLARGAIAEGRYADEGVAAVGWDHQRTARVAFRFLTEDDREHTAIATTFEPRRFASRAVLVAYDPLRPQVNLVLSTLPGDPLVEPSGAIRLRESAPTGPYLLLALLAVVSHAAMAGWLILA
jgi:hypothetical protein